MHQIITREGKGIGKPIEETVEDVGGDTKVFRYMPDGLYIRVSSTDASLNRPSMSSWGRVARPHHPINLDSGESEVVYDNGCLASLVGLRKQVLIKKP